ncbi:uncharacterized protein LOC122813420 [Protopterus annectens]|uniref:uncharacterized protein LOC122813420 n=1 Tax=Protopterus annectens TaxID=7888 RepID=UPI001CFC2B5B|nr:uncharacterized protein LOC122813420 [Protopterus annectens]
MSSAAPVTLKSAIESMLTWTNLKNNKTTEESKMHQKNKHIFNIVMTPDRIPQFFIPSLDLSHSYIHVDLKENHENSVTKGRGEDKTAVIHSLDRSESETNTRKECAFKRKILLKKSSANSVDGADLSWEMERATDHADPATRAALSLPHFPKITTPYGFLALGESPHIRRKESLFFEHDTTDIRTLFSQRKTLFLSRSRSNPLSESRQSAKFTNSSASMKTSRSASCEAIASTFTPLSLPLPQSNEECCLKSEKKTFQSLIEKHLSHIKRMRSSNSTSERQKSALERTQSNPFA